MSELATTPESEAKAAVEAAAATAPTKPGKQGKLTLAKGVVMPELLSKPPTDPNTLLVSILRTRRADGSEGEKQFRIWLFQHLKQMTGKEPTALALGCLYVQIGKGKTLFSCHVDTVHGVQESNAPGAQELSYDSVKGHIFLSNLKSSGCLGADNGAGIYMLLNLIEAKVPGGYIFHTGEERGGKGSRAVRKDHQAMLDGYDRAVAFDRRGGAEVIHTQGGMRCASDVASMWLCSKLNDAGLAYKPSDRGSFTDTKIYADTIPECFNVAVGYDFEHGPQEILDVTHLENLVSVCKTVPWDDMPTVRKPEALYTKPKTTKYKTPSYESYGFPGFGGLGSNDFEDYEPPRSPFKTPQQAAKPIKVSLPSFCDSMPKYVGELFDGNQEDVQNFVDAEPVMAAAALTVLMGRVAALEAEKQVYLRLLGT
jgi:hypothetical protein